jgi:hypothetical protein
MGAWWDRLVGEELEMRGSVWPRAGRSRAAVIERDSPKDLSKADGGELVISEKNEPVDEGASTERGRTAGESLLEEDCLLFEDVVPFKFIMLLMVVGKKSKASLEMIPIK